MNFGLIPEEEQEAIKISLIELSKIFDSINILEIGCRELKTANAMVSICEENNIDYNYYGIDINIRGKPAYSNMNIYETDANSF